jgi:PAS domain-containing protein
LWGTLAFVTWRKEHTSPIAEIEALIMASEVIGSAISRYQTEELFHKPVERSLVGVYLVQDYRFIYTNPRLSEILGCNRENLENSPLLRYIHPEDADMVCHTTSGSSKILMKRMIMSLGALPLMAG